MGCFWRRNIERERERDNKKSRMQILMELTWNENNKFESPYSIQKGPLPYKKKDRCIQKWTLPYIFCTFAICSAISFGYQLYIRTSLPQRAAISTLIKTSFG